VVTPVESDAEEYVEEEEVPVVCKFKPLRGKNAKPCTKLATQPWGFCSTHNRTNQAKAAKKEYEEEKQRKEAERIKELEKELDELNELDDEEDTEEYEYAENGDYSDVGSGDEKILKLVPNRWGRFEDANTGIVFNQETKVAIGMQDADGKVYDLDESAIEECIKNGWAYMQPTKKAKIPPPKEEEEEEENDQEEEEEVAQEEEIADD
jgi:hypothetical protein